MLAEARNAVVDTTAAEPDRLAALRVLGREPAERAADVSALAKLLVPRNSVVLQSAAVAALGRIPEERVAGVLIPGWKSYTPTLKSQVLELLLSRDIWQHPLLRSIEKREVPAAQIDAKHRQRLLNHRDEQVRLTAEKLFAGAVSPDRDKVLQDHRDVASLTGDRTRGKAVFAKSCAACHRLHDVGNEVGPDLAALANKTPVYLLTEILAPNKNVDTRYLEYLAVTKAGRTFTGILASETATSITLRGQEAKEQVLLRSELEELQSTGKSLMPEGLEKDLSKQDLADLIAYLATGGN
jgi:putative heme-binding domain-containing protein